MLLIVEALRSAAPLRRECFCFWLTFNQFIQKLPTVIVLIMQIYVWYNWIIIIDAFITSTVTMELTVTTLHTDGALITHLHLSLVTCQIKKWKLPVIVLSPKGQKTSTDDSFSYSWRLLYCNPQCSSAVTTCHTRTHQNPPALLPVLPVCSALLSDHAGARTSWPWTSCDHNLYNNSQCHVNVDNLKLYIKNRLKYNLLNRHNPEKPGSQLHVCCRELNSNINNF